VLTRILDAALDASLVLSWDRTGFRRHARHFAADDLAADLRGRVCLVTGANAGLGRAAAAGLARRGARVGLLCRSEARGREAERALRAETGSREVFYAPLDASDLVSVRACAARLAGERVDVLVHNAGVLPAERGETRDGLELTFATHVVGPWLLTNLLEPGLRRAGAARVVLVSSGGMYAARLSCDDVDWRRRPYDGVAAYAQTKRMQVVLAGLLAERLAPAGCAVHAMHPGWARTPGVESSLPRFFRLTRSILRTPEEGADTILWLALAPEPGRSSGRFWFDRAERTTHLLPWTREPAGERERLLALVERSAGLGAPERAPAAPRTARRAPARRGRAAGTAR
jgi:NAD(P)-dependent dehydrogenase (short-subunit alcohol dehydrogenase family)